MADNSDRSHVAIEIAQDYKPLVSSIQSMMESKTNAHCICRVDERIRNEDNAYYVPDKISIGPLHYGKETVKPMEDHKWRYLYSLLDRRLNVEASLNACVQALKELEHKARLCYSEHINLSSDDFVKMLLVDGGFIIELFLRHLIKGLKRRNDPIFSTPGMLFELRSNMILLENQIPFFVLQQLFQIVPIPRRCNFSLTDLAFRFFRNMIPGDHQIHREKFSLEGNHLLDLLRHCFLPTIPRVQAKHFEAQKGVECVTKLKENGIKIMKAKTENLLDIKFVNGVLEIPPIKFHQYTESLLRNLIAFEQCSCDNTHHITSYIMLMGSLISSEKDVKFLNDQDILLTDRNVSNVSDTDVLKLFQRLGTTVNTFTGVNESEVDFYYDGLSEQVNGYKRSSKWRAYRRRKAYKLPLNLMIVVGFILLLVITFVGTLFSVLSFSIHR